MRLIDADKLEQIIKKNIKDYEETNDPIRCDANKIHLSTVRGMPTIDAEPVRHGRWLPHKITASSTCSLCRRVFADETPCCPNCGAKMDGGESK